MRLKLHFSHLALKLYFAVLTQHYIVTLHIENTNYDFYEG
jgi:hypothetical protein